jgi:uncharacterized damage-inducible protein DinB
MNLNLACSHILRQLADLIHQIRPDDFARPVESLSNSTIGQHLRHTLEFFLCFQKGYEHGTVNYDKRAHDKLIESDKFIALSAISQIHDFVDQLQDKKLALEVGYDLVKEDFETIQTTATRELVYNIEHAVHHMAIIKIGVREVANYITLPHDFGIAASTVRYHESAPSSR